MRIWQVRVAFIVCLVVWSISMSDDCQTDDDRNVRGRCSVCQRSLQIRRDGLVRIHGSARNRCQGSEQRPIPQENSILPNVDDSTQSAIPMPHVSNPMDSLMDLLRGTRISTIKRIPRASRNNAASKLSQIIDTLISDSNNIDFWILLLLFPKACLRVPSRGGQRWSLSTLLNRQISAETLPEPQCSAPRVPRKSSSVSEDMDRLAVRVSSKLEEDGDFAGAVRLASSTKAFAKCDRETLAALQSKHPPTHPNSTFCAPPPPLDCASLVVSQEEVWQAIRSFRKGSVGGPDGLRPQHLFNLTSKSTGPGGQCLLQSLTTLTNLILAGKVPSDFRPIFFGASLTALRKKEGGIRPIAVGCTLRRLVAKCASKSVAEEMGKMLGPLQLGFGVSRGVEAAVHAARSYVEGLSPSNAVVKLDIKNAFNSVRRDKMLEAVKTHAPQLLPFVHCNYSCESSLLFGGNVISSAEGVQQGDPLGPLLFCLTVHPFC